MVIRTRMWVDPARTAGKSRVLPWEVSYIVRGTGLPGWQHTGMVCEKSAEAIVGRQLGEAIEALQGRKVEQQIGCSRQGLLKGRIL